MTLNADIDEVTPNKQVRVNQVCQSICQTDQESGQQNMTKQVCFTDLTCVS